MPETHLHDVYRLSWHYRIDGNAPITLAHWYQCVTEPHIPDQYPVYMLFAFRSVIRNNLQGYLSSDVTSIGFTSEKFDADRRDVIEGFSYADVFSGTRNLRSSAPIDTMTVQLRTVYIGRREIGKRYLAGVPNAWLDRGFWTAGDGPILLERFRGAMGGTLSNQGGVGSVAMRPILPMRPLTPGPNVTLPEFVTKVNKSLRARTRTKYAVDRKRQ